MVQGEKPRSEWDELCLRIPELHTKSDGAAERTAFSENSPINEILRVHKAIRLELQGILDASIELSGYSNPNAVSSLAERCNFLGRMVREDRDRPRPRQRPCPPPRKETLKRPPPRR